METSSIFTGVQDNIPFYFEVKSTSTPDPGSASRYIGEALNIVYAIQEYYPGHQCIDQGIIDDLIGLEEVLSGLEIETNRSGSNAGQQNYGIYLKEIEDIDEYFMNRQIQLYEEVPPEKMADLDRERLMLRIINVTLIGLLLIGAYKALTNETEANR